MGIDKYHQSKANRRRATRWLDSWLWYNSDDNLFDSFAQEKEENVLWREIKKRFKKRKRRSR